MDMKTQISSFENYLTEEEKSEATVEKNIRDVRAFAQFLCGREPSKGALVQYKKSIAESYAPSSVNSMLVSVNSFLKFIGRADAAVKLLKIQRQMFASEKKELSAAKNTRLEL